MSFSYRIFEFAQYLFLTSYYYEPRPVSCRVIVKLSLMSRSLSTDDYNSEDQPHRLDGRHKQKLGLFTVSIATYRTY